MIAISAAAINDVVGWLLLAMVTSITVAAFSPGSFAVRVAMVAQFFAGSWLFVRPVMRFVIGKLSSSDDPLPRALIGILLAVVFAGAMATYQLGIFAIFGGFMMGVILFDERRLSTRGTRAWAHSWRSSSCRSSSRSRVRTDIGSLTSAADWGWCALVIVLATVGKSGGCYFAARICGLTRAQSGMLGIMMNTRALMELIVLNVGLDLGVISPRMFTMRVLMAIVSTVVTTPLLRRRMAAAGHGMPVSMKPDGPAATAARRRIRDQRRESRRRSSIGSRSANPVISRRCIHVSNALSRP